MTLLIQLKNEFIQTIKKLQVTIQSLLLINIITVIKMLFFFVRLYWSQHLLYFFVCSSIWKFIFLKIPCTTKCVHSRIWRIIGTGGRILLFKIYLHNIYIKNTNNRSIDWKIRSSRVLIVVVDTLCHEELLYAPGTFSRCSYLTANIWRSPHGRPLSSNCRCDSTPSFGQDYRAPVTTKNLHLLMILTSHEFKKSR